MRCIILSIFMLILSITNSYPNEKIIPKEIYDDFISFGKNYGKCHFKLRNLFKINATNSRCEEYIAFYFISDVYEQSLYDLVRIYQLKDKKILKIYNIYQVSCFDYNIESEYNLKQIKELEKYFGEWNGYFYAYDLNGNGVPELFLYTLCGLGGSFGVYEYSKEKDRFETIITGGEMYNYGKIVIDKKGKAIVIYQHYEPKGNYPAHILHYIEIEYKWNSEKKKYEKRFLRDGLTWEDLQKIKD